MTSCRDVTVHWTRSLVGGCGINHFRRSITRRDSKLQMQWKTRDSATSSIRCCRAELHGQTVGAGKRAETSSGSYLWKNVNKGSRLCEWRYGDSVAAQ
ncbi:hypothetical protein POX_e06787 [Penicillium oxalicum]|uniref:Uncharacterized protein n=1 Tax=Penicillium oxalicum (strain 114-2 / CGMCC 5302) TaxID=933388 RepID=S7ZGN5_PENO1|nr:hypothetical protein POX_e06787 [Penicillium oxalicum]EPS27806.1 hypothetical protein PDE_02750 [Penicillium oxalicum 114-2]KAI2788766.1 hypothetical protein POX_e06787 [Penicillium oxalicum]